MATDADFRPPFVVADADVHLCNVHTLALADGDAAYCGLLQQATLNLADGKSVAWMGKLTGIVGEGAPARTRTGLDVSSAG